MNIQSIQKAGIYKISSLIDNREYVGSSVNIHKRWVSHKNELIKNKHRNKKLQRFFNKYGMDKLFFSVIEFCEIDNLIQKEQFYLDSKNYEFNICTTAGNTLGLRLSDDVKKHLSSIRRGVQTTGMLGKKHNPETITKLILKAKARGLNPAFKKASLIANLGRKHTNQHRTDIANKQRKVNFSDAQNILNQLDMKVKQTDLAKIHGVSQKVISRINLGVGIYKADKDYYEASIKRIQQVNQQIRMFA